MRICNQSLKEYKQFQGVCVLGENRPTELSQINQLQEPVDLSAHAEFSFISFV